MNLLLLALVVVVYHETAHALAAHEFGAFNGIIAFRHKERLKSLLVWGVAIQVDDDAMTDTQMMIALLAPLVYLPVAGLAYLGYIWTGIDVLMTGVLVLVLAGGAVLVSDIPMWYFDLTDDSNHKYWWLYPRGGE